MTQRKLEFAPGCFDDFTGTQAELDAMVLEIRRLFESGELERDAVPLDLDQWDDVEISAEVLGLDSGTPRTRH